MKLSLTFAIHLRSDDEKHSTNMSPEGVFSLENFFTLCVVAEQASPGINVELFSNHAWLERC
jgi:hypothetical protein